MNYLQYTSSEMFSSTDLIRKSKKIFDKLNTNEIEKAIILRDGKPSFMLMDFDTYETIMNEYLELKNKVKNETKKTKVKNEVIQEQESNKTVEFKNSTTINQAKEVLSKNSEEINPEDIEKAFKEIEKLNFDKTTEKDKKEALKEFWE